MGKIKDRIELFSYELRMISVNIDELSMDYYGKMYMKEEFIWLWFYQNLLKSWTIWNN